MPKSAPLLLATLLLGMPAAQPVDTALENMKSAREQEYKLRDAGGHIEFLLRFRSSGQDEVVEHHYVEWRQDRKYRFGEVDVDAPIAVSDGERTRTSGGVCWDEAYISRIMFPGDEEASLSASELQELNDAKNMHQIVFESLLFPLTRFTERRLDYLKLRPVDPVDQDTLVHDTPVEVEPSDLFFHSSLKGPLLGTDVHFLYMMDEDAFLKASGYAIGADTSLEWGWYYSRSDPVEVGDSLILPREMIFYDDHGTVIYTLELLPDQSSIGVPPLTQFTIDPESCTTSYDWPEEPLDWMDRLNAVLSSLDRQGWFGWPAKVLGAVVVFAGVLFLGARQVKRRRKLASH